MPYICQKSLISIVSILPSWSLFLDLEKHFLALFLRDSLNVWWISPHFWQSVLFSPASICLQLHLFIHRNLENKRPHNNASSYFLWNVRKLTELLIFSTDVNVSRLPHVFPKISSSIMMPITSDIRGNCATEDLKLVYS